MRGGGREGVEEVEGVEGGGMGVEACGEGGRCVEGGEGRKGAEQRVSVCCQVMIVYGRC